MRILRGAETGGDWLVRVVREDADREVSSIVFAWLVEGESYCGGVVDDERAFVVGTEFGFDGEVRSIEDIEAVLQAHGFGGVVYEVPELLIAERAA